MKQTRVKIMTKDFPLTAFLLTFHISLPIYTVASWKCVLTIDFSYLCSLWKLHYNLWRKQAKKQTNKQKSAMLRSRLKNLTPHFQPIRNSVFPAKVSNFRDKWLPKLEIYSLRHRKCGRTGLYSRVVCVKIRTSEVRASESFWHKQRVNITPYRAISMP